MTEVSAADIAATYDCKTPGCTGTARSRVGRYSYCDDCRERRAGQKQSNGGATGGAFASKVKDLDRAAKLADRARAAAVAATQKAIEAKQEADAREREFRDLARDLMGGAA